MQSCEQPMLQPALRVWGIIKWRLLIALSVHSFQIVLCQKTRGLFIAHLRDLNVRPISCLMAFIKTRISHFRILLWFSFDIQWM